MRLNYLSINPQRCYFSLCRADLAITSRTEWCSSTLLLLLLLFSVIYSLLQFWLWKWINQYKITDCSLVCLVSCGLVSRAANFRILSRMVVLTRNRWSWWVLLLILMGWYFTAPWQRRSCTQTFLWWRKVKNIHKHTPRRLVRRCVCRCKQSRCRNVVQTRCFKQVAGTENEC